MSSPLTCSYCFCPVRPSVCHTCFRSITIEPLGLRTSYLVCRLVMPSGRSLLILSSEGQRSWSPWPCELKNGFRTITEERLGPVTPCLVCRLVMPSGRSLLILSSVGLKSRSQWPWAERSQWLTFSWKIDFEVRRSKFKVTVTLWAKKWCMSHLFPLNNWRMLGPKNFILGMQDGHDQ